ncbi:MAG: phosphatidylserine decarboxylase [Kordiimonadaceae bacterium]|nr:phosphatidylserine decarboxylase [Kordiimonadaceae bacterium]
MNILKAIKVIFWQIAILAVCGMVIGYWAIRFPYPSPLIFDLLSPNKRWPTQQVADWVTSGNIDEGFMTFFYRDPDRIIPAGDDMVAPADGSIRYIDEKDGVKYVVIALTFWDVHVQRSPVSGIVVKIEDQGDTLMDGEAYNMVYLKEKMSPVQKIIHIQSDWGLIKVRLITSALARRIEVWPKVGDKIEKGQRLGRIHLGSTVVVDVPDQLTPAVNIRDVVVGGESILFKAEELKKIEGKQ